MDDINIRRVQHLRRDNVWPIVDIAEEVFPAEYIREEWREGISREVASYFIASKSSSFYDAVYVAEKDDKVVGFAIFSPEGFTRTLKLFQIGVAKEHQGKGVGTQLLKESIDDYVKYFSENFGDVYAVYLTTSSDNPVGHKLYEKCGFKKVGCMKDVFLGKGNVEDIMLKVIDEDRVYPEGELWNKVEE